MDCDIEDVKYDERLEGNELPRKVGVPSKKGSKDGEKEKEPKLF